MISQFLTLWVISMVSEKRQLKICPIKNFQKEQKFFGKNWTKTFRKDTKNGENIKKYIFQFFACPISAKLYGRMVSSSHRDHKVTSSILFWWVYTQYPQTPSMEKIPWLLWCSFFQLYLSWSYLVCCLRRWQKNLRHWPGLELKCRGIVFLLGLSTRGKQLKGNNWGHLMIDTVERSTTIIQIVGICPS